MLGQRRRRCPNIKKTLDQLVFSRKNMSAKQCRFDVGPALVALVRYRIGIGLPPCVLQEDVVTRCGCMESFSGAPWATTQATGGGVVVSPHPLRRLKGTH